MPADNEIAAGRAAMPAEAAMFPARVAHTPGPWVYGQNNAQKKTGDQWEIGLHLGEYVSGILGFRDGDYMLVSGICSEADARLMAAAPDLLAALEQAEQQIEYGQIGFALEFMRAAMLKARGA